MCMLSKDICPICNKNKDGFCSSVEKPVSEIMKQWESSQRSKAKRKLKENDYFFSDKRFDKIEELVYKIKKNPMRRIGKCKKDDLPDSLVCEWRD